MFQAIEVDNQNSRHFFAGIFIFIVMAYIQTNHSHTKTVNLCLRYFLAHSFVWPACTGNIDVHCTWLIKKAASKRKYSIDIFKGNSKIPTFSFIWRAFKWLTGICFEWMSTEFPFGIAMCTTNPIYFSLLVIDYELEQTLLQLMIRTRIEKM